MVSFIDKASLMKTGRSGVVKLSFYAPLNSPSLGFLSTLIFWTLDLFNMELFQLSGSGSLLYMFLLLHTEIFGCPFE